MTALTGETTPPVAAPAAMMPPVDAACTSPVQREATGVSIFLRMDITDQQRLDLNAALQSDPLVRSATFDSREQAYARFAELYKDSPGLLKSVTVDQFPESIRVKLAEPSEYTAFVAKLKSTRGIDVIQGSVCPKGSPSGERE
jgi:cell division protein FtsX